MYKCEHCQQQIVANIPSQLFSIETRQKHYPARRNRTGQIIDPGGDGFETAREIKVCPSCNERLSDKAVSP